MNVTVPYHVGNFLREATMADDQPDKEKGLPACRRPVGLLRGQIWIAEDFDETPEDLIALMEGDEAPTP